MSGFNQDLKSLADKVDHYLKDFFQNQSVDSKLYEAMKYGLFPGGKMLRPYLVHATSNIFNLKQEDYIPIAAAVECIHSYSLIHDDLPSMDNDDFRRGKESTHKAFGEYTAILAGSSLLTMAFEIISNPEFKISSEKKIKIIHSLSSCSGQLGIAGGQYFDLSLKKEDATIDKIIDLQNKKTGALMGFCTEAAVILADQEKLEIKFKNLGIKIGLLFQIADDFLDKYGDQATLGKPSQQDDEKGKNTLINFLGEDKTKEFIDNARQEIEEELKDFSNTEKIKSCIDYILKRKN